MSTPSQFTFRARRALHEIPTIMESYGEGIILPLLRQYFPKLDHRGQKLGNFDFGPLIEAAARTAAKIDLADENEGLLDQVIFGIANPDMCHPGIKDIAEDRELVVLLLVRHLKKSGGLILPPLSSAVHLQNAHWQVVAADITAGREPAQMHYANWRQAQSMAPPGSGVAATRGGTSVRGGQGGGGAGRRISRGGGSGGNQ